MVHLTDVVNQANRAGANLLTNRPALSQDGAFTFEFVAQLGRAFGLAFHGLWAGLQNIKQAVGAILAPLDVHGATVMLFDDHRVAGQLLDLIIGQAVAVAQLGGHVGGFDQLARSRFFLRAGEHHLNELGAQVAANHAAIARGQHRLVDIELVRVHGTLHHRLAQTVARGDEHHVFEARLSVDGEHDARRTQIRAHHALHAR